jgi:hypothetical protein
MRTLVATEGVSSLYRGLISPVAGYGLIKATAFASYNQAKTFFETNQDWNNNVITTRSLTLTELALSGAFAGFCQTFVRAPVEQIKVVMQARSMFKRTCTHNLGILILYCVYSNV